MRPAPLFALCLLCSGFVYARPVETGDYKDVIRVACVGDSITDGWGVGHDWDYPSQLGRMLRDKWWVVNFGASGTTMLKNGDDPYWKHGQYQNALSFNPDVVIIALGTNDMKEKNWAKKTEFFGNYKEMIETFRALPSKPLVYLCLPPPVTKDGVLTIPMTRPAEIGTAIRQFATAMSCDVIDFYSTMITHPDWQPDNLHPDPNGDFALAKTVYTALTGKPYEGAMILTTQRPQPKRWP
ncbi:MAG TPA: GDSL-type esterase/lipase family protein [Rariglobus sp.]|jgi:lysophospholipase L1-like esterase|nr:GDSL-type esterase/lipase family protein [Rariglobus sp.]